MGLLHFNSCTWILPNRGFPVYHIEHLLLVSPSRDKRPWIITWHSTDLVFLEVNFVTRRHFWQANFFLGGEGIAPSCILCYYWVSGHDPSPSSQDKTSSLLFCPGFINIYVTTSLIAADSGWLCSVESLHAKCWWRPHFVFARWRVGQGTLLFLRLRFFDFLIGVWWQDSLELQCVNLLT